MQSPSSLIFLVLLGVWAAYFVQYWVRRRDHVATARSVEQFSEAMRVLERRDPLPRTDLSEPAPRSYAVHPARTARPQVLVKRAVASEPGPIGVTERISDSDAVAPVAAPATRPSSPSPAGPVRRPAPVGAGRRRVHPSRRVRGLLLLAAIVELLVIAPLVATSMLPLWALAPALLAVGWAALFARAGARAEQAMARATRRRQADLARRRTGAPVAPRGAGVRRSSAPAASGRPAAASVAESVEVAESVGTAESVGREHAESVGREHADDVVTLTEPALVGTDSSVVEPVAAEAVEPVAPVEPAADVMVPIVDEDDIPLTWDPVPVPRPTYTMKAKAERAEVAPAAVTPDPAPVARESESDDSAYDQRRVAGG
ncbi:MAG TPA: hypothetical protein VNN23_01125 [Ornithinibacter sp.]|nr:hypothetical protein [Ornithinibacter sp.]